MARTPITTYKITCDECDQVSGTETTDADSITILVHMDGTAPRVYTIDLCEMHQRHVTALTRQLEECGRRESGFTWKPSGNGSGSGPATTVTDIIRSAPRKVPAPVKGELRLRCLECEELPVLKDFSWQSHCEAKHRAEKYRVRYDLVDYPEPYVCGVQAEDGVCTAKFPAKSSLNSHKRMTKHH